MSGSMSSPLPPALPSALPAMRRLVAFGIAVAALLVLGFGGWAAVARLAGAVVTQGTVVVETNLKKVQHPHGGVVGALHVREGAEVRAGELLLSLDDTVMRANLAMVTKSLDGLEGRRARLEAERDEADTIAFPADLVARAASEPEIARLVAGERRLFEARRAARGGQKAQLGERIAQLRQEIEGFDAQIVSKDAQIALILGELKGVSELYDRNLVPLTRLAALQREAARLNGERGQIVAAAAQARGRIAETELQILQLDQELRTEVLKELREIETRSGELVERKAAADDQLRRVEIRSPQDGVVHQLAVHTVGGVIGPGEVVMLVVPRADAMTIEAQIAPQDIDQVTRGQPAMVRLSAFSQRTTPELAGRVMLVAADLTRNPQNGAAYYIARIELPDSELARLQGLRLVPGMPAEVHIQTGERTALSYFLKPLSDQIARAFKED